MSFHLFAFTSSIISGEVIFLPYIRHLKEQPTNLHMHVIHVNNKISEKKLNCVIDSTQIFDILIKVYFLFLIFFFRIKKIADEKDTLHTRINEMKCVENC